MKLCFVYNEKNDKYDKLAKEISSYFKQNGSKVKVANTVDEIETVGDNNGAKEDKRLKVYTTKDDLYVFFSDSPEELKQNYEKLKRPKKAMIITENLTVEYIMLCVDLAKNICYAKKDISEICSRIEAMYEKYMEE